MAANDAFDVDSWLDQLENDRPKSGNGLVKLLMNTKVNKGNIIFVPFKDQKSGNFYTKLTGVREFKMYSEESDTEIWHKILPKEYYGELTPTQSQLYDEVASYFDRALNEEWVDYDYARWRSYVFFYGYVLDHTTESGTTVTDSINKPALIEFPSAKLINSVADAIQSKNKSLKSKEWIPVVFNDSPVNRQGMVSIKIAGGKGGYDFTVVLEIQNAYSKVIPDTFDATDIKPLFKDSIADYLGWQNGPEGSYFNEEMFEKVRNGLLVLFGGGKSETKQDDTQAQPQTQEAPVENKPDQVPAFDPRKPF